MKLYKNKEVIKILLLQIILSVVFIVLSFIGGMKYGLFMSAVCCFFVLIYLFSVSRRYRKIAKLSEDIDRILHGENEVSFDEYSEGELGILQSEIYKMTVRLREQSNNLKKDKKYLADSIADISHQLRTPLTSINLLVSFLSEENISTQRRESLTHELYELLSRVDRLITVLLKISKLDAGTVEFKKEEISLESLIEKSLSPLLVPLEIRRQTLSLSADGIFSGDVLWTGEAISNIVKNCMEHTPEGGEIRITASENALYSEIIIEDTGEGISKKDLPHIFERFYKGENSGDKSFGIGLNLARMIITLQNGTVKAENGEEKGAVFTVRFYKGTV